MDLLTGGGVWLIVHMADDGDTATIVAAVVVAAKQGEGNWAAGAEIVEFVGDWRHYGNKTLIEWEDGDAYSYHSEPSRSRRNKQPRVGPATWPMRIVGALASSASQPGCGSTANTSSANLFMLAKPGGQDSLVHAVFLIVNRPLARVCELNVEPLTSKGTGIASPQRRRHGRTAIPLGAFVSLLCCPGRPEPNPWLEKELVSLTDDPTTWGHEHRGTDLRRTPSPRPAGRRRQRLRLATNPVVAAREERLFVDESVSQ